MYTSSTIRTSTANYPHQPSNRINYNSYQHFDETNSTARRANANSMNSPSSLSNLPHRTVTMTPTRKYPPASSRAYANESDSYRSQSYNDLSYDPVNSSHRTEFYDEDLIVKSTDLSASTEQEMLELVRTAFRKYDLNNQRELAGFLKRSADRAFSSCWHCIVGRQFSSYVTHEMNGFIYLTKGPLSILLFKSGT